MKKSPLLVVLVILALVIGALAWSVTRTKDTPATATTQPETSIDETTMESSATATPESPTSAHNAGDSHHYIDYYPGAESDTQLGKRVLFFNAKWCPTCKALTSDIKANLNSIPETTTIISVDYDTYTDLKKRYGVTYQHTMVQVGDGGTQIKKWSSSPTLASLLEQVQ